MSVKRTIYVLLIVISILPIILTSGLQLVTINYWSESLISKNLINSANSFKAIIEDFFTQQNIDMSIVSHMPIIRDYLENTRDDKVTEIQMELDRRARDKYYIDFYALYDADKNILLSTSKQILSVYPSLPFDVEPNKEVTFTDFLSHPLYEEQNGIILALAPIEFKNEIIGYLLGGYNNTYFSHIIENVSLENKVKVRLEDGNGKVVSTLGLFVLTEGQANNFTEVSAKVDFQANPTGMIQFDNYKYKEIAYYTPIEDTSLRLYAAVNLLDYNYPTHTMLTNMFIVFLVVTTLVVIIATWIAQVINKYIGSTLDTMIRIKNGDYKARLNTTGKHEIHYVMETFNDLLNTIEHNHDELYRSSDRYKTAIQTFSDVFFEIDILNDVIEFGDNDWIGKLGVMPTMSYKEAFQLFYESYISEEDKAYFYESMEPKSLIMQFGEMESGERNSIALQFRWRNPKFGVAWLSMTIVPIYDRNGNMHSMVGFIKDIHEQKTKEIQLMTEAQKDGLTGLNNKITTERLIENLLAKSNTSQKHALLIIDLDDFKLVNDTHGHLIGDDVLRMIAQLLQTRFRTTDIIGRIGGDEFVVFMQDVSESLVLKKANEIASSLTDFADFPFDMKVSCSIGLAFYPREGTHFLDLFEQADKALYVVKESGKNQIGYLPASN